jgi:hypothetical protein
MPMNPAATGDLERANPNHRTVIDPYSEMKWWWKSP